ncbi:hypothetical protein [Fusobacterium nucleatum]|uniref:hypothetical protein n=1 Tax=Fusobacterium nucleatum TaxID=851 RepID=UPI0030CCFD88
MEKSTDISDCLKIDDKIEEVDGKNIFDFLFKTGTLKDSEGSDIEKNKKIKSELEIEEEKYLESIFEGRKNEFNSIFSTINGNNVDESPEEKLKKFIWLNFNMENFYLDDNVGIGKNIAVELFLTDEEIKNGTTKIVKYEKTELISKYNYINETEEIESQTVEYEKKIVIPQNIEEGTVYKFIDFGNCFEDIDEKIQQGDLYVFILRGVENEYM